MLGSWDSNLVFVHGTTAPLLSISKKNGRMYSGAAFARVFALV